MPWWDRFDICSAYFWYAVDYHGGQNSETYKIFGRLERMKFKVSPLHGSIEDESENAQAIYENLLCTGYKGEPS